VKRIHGLGPARRIEVALGSDGNVIEIDASHIKSVDSGEGVGLVPNRYRIFATHS
jgi:hypothetical protein